MKLPKEKKVIFTVMLNKYSYEKRTNTKRRGGKTAQVFIYTK